jgi:hypothetical protein
MDLIKEEDQKLKKEAISIPVGPIWNNEHALYLA